MGKVQKNLGVVPKDKELLTVKEAHAVLEGTVSLGTIYAMIHANEIPTRRIRTRIIISRKDLLGVLG